MAEDYYKTLGVSRNASQAEIQKAYRELARKYHPDMNPDEPEKATRKFQEIQAAFDVLNNPEKREMYDRYGSSFETAGAGPRGGPGGGSPFGNVSPEEFAQFFGERFGDAAGGGGAGGGAAGFEEILRHFQGGGMPGGRSRRGAAPRRGGDLESELEIPFATAIAGGSVSLTVNRGRNRSETIDVKIPPGIEDGKKIRLRGQGEPGPRGGQPGDLLITIQVAPHPHFHRSGSELHVRVPVSLAEAVQGAKIDIPTPKGIVSLRVPPGTSSGKKLRVRGHGVPIKNGEAGDLLAEVQIVLPKDMSDKDRETIAQIDQKYPQNPRAGLRW